MIVIKCIKIIKPNINMYLLVILVLNYVFNSQTNISLVKLVHKIITNFT